MSEMVDALTGTGESGVPVWVLLLIIAYIVAALLTETWRFWKRSQGGSDGRE